MSEIKEGDWVVTKKGIGEEKECLGTHCDVFTLSMSLPTPMRVFRNRNIKGWFSINYHYCDYDYHPDWLIKVNQDGTPYKWSWLSELGWE